MDGVIYHGNRLLPGAGEFVAWLKAQDKRFLFLTNSSERSAAELSQKLARLGIEVDMETVLVLSGVTSMEDLRNFAYSPRHVLEGVFEIPD